MTVTELCRPLSPIERWYWIADQISTLNVVARTRLIGHFPSDVLERATAALAAEYPALRAAVTADIDGLNPAFVPTMAKPQVRRVRGSGREWLRRLDDHELVTPVDWASGPLVRVVDIVVDGADETHDLLLTVSHVIADGTTALTLLRKLIEHADRLVAVGDEAVVSRSAVAAPEALLPKRHRGARGIAAVVWIGLVDRVVTAWARPRRLPPESALPMTKRRTRLVHRALDAAMLDDLTRRCRAEGVTVHGALTAAMVIALGPAAAESDSDRICIGSPIDFRTELDPPVPADEVGAYVSTVPSILRLGGCSDFWSIARRANRTLRRRKRLGQHLALLSALRFVCPPSVTASERMIGLIERNGPGNICLSNIGRFDFPDRIGAWELSHAQFIAAISVSGYFVATVNTSHGQLFWNFTYIDGVVSESSAHSYADSAVEALVNAIGIQ